MAEKATAGHIFAVRLSYRDLPDGETPVGARLFQYEHVQKFFKVVRELVFRRTGNRQQLRYIVAGEMGSQRGRVHYHVVMFSSLPLADIGEWEDVWTGEKMPMPLERNVIWNCWPHGHVYVQQPDAGGVAYALKYALKDQLSVVNSRGTARETRAENYAAALFRMSKRPPIGQPFLGQRLEQWRERLIVPPDLRIRVPDYRGYWYPTGALREYLLQGLHEINSEHVERHGRDVPTWAALMSSAEKSETDWEALQYGQEEEAELTEEQERAIRRREKQEARRAEQARNRFQTSQAIVRNCGRFTACDDCRLHAEIAGPRPAWLLAQPGGPEDQGWYENPPEPSPGCLIRGRETTRAAFAAARGVWRLHREIKGPRDL